LPEHLRALVFILAFAGTIFFFAKKPITEFACTVEDFKRRRNLWIALTLAAFLAHNIWLFVAVASGLLIYAMRTETRPFGLYLGVLLCLPRLSASIPGFGLINELFSVDPLRLLALFVLLPTYLRLRKQPGVAPFGSLFCDKVMLATFALELVLTLPNRTVPSILRDTVFNNFTNVFLIYYVASRALRTLPDWRDAMGAFTVSALILSVILFSEFGRHWLLYSAVDKALGVSGGERGYLIRSGMVRAEGTAGQSIVAGFTIAVAIGLYMYTRTLILRPWARRLGMAVLIFGIVGAFARAPWLGATGMILLFMLLGPSPVGSIGKLVGAILLSIPFLVMTPAGLVIIDHLPWVGTVDSRNVDGREHLAQVAFKVVMQNPFFGNYDFATTPAIEDLRGSDGIIDLVNTYVILALRGGLVTLGFFWLLVLGAFFSVINVLLKLPRTDERYTIARALFSTMVGALFIMGTVSPIFFVFPLYWMLAGLMVGLAQMVKQGEPAGAKLPAQPVAPSSRTRPGLGAAARHGSPRPRG
jgi:hypothetical protein